MSKPRASVTNASGEMVNAFDPSSVNDLPPTTRHVVARRNKLLGPAYRLQYARPVEFVRGEGTWLFGADGNRYLDAYNNVPSVGHCHPRVVEALTRQAGNLNTNTRYLDVKILEYAERLLDTHSDALNNVMFTCTGSEANDLALRVARYYTGGEGVIISSHAYHGVTASTAAISPTLGNHVPLGREVRTVGLPFGIPVEEAAAYLKAQVIAAVADLDRHGIPLAAFIVDTVFSSDGLLTDPAGFLRPAVDAVHEAGGLFIADEVQSGFGRTGDAMWGYQRHGVSPDLAVMGKSMGNGMPIAGMAARSEVLAEFGEKTRYFNTFGGNSVSIAAAAAVLGVIQDENLLLRTAGTGAALRSRIGAAIDGNTLFGELRAVGLYLGLDVRGDDTRSDTEVTSIIVNAMRDHGVLISAMGTRGQTLKIRPPLAFSEEHIDTFISAFELTLTDLAKMC